MGAKSGEKELCLVADIDTLGSKKLGYKVIILRWSEVKQVVDTLMVIMTPAQLANECNSGRLKLINATPTKDGKVRRKEWKDTISCIRYITYIINNSIDKEIDVHGELRAVYTATALQLLGITGISVKSCTLTYDLPTDDECSIEYKLCYSHKLGLYLISGLDTFNTLMNENSRFEEVICQQTLPNKISID